jgi:hypothetical protein
MKSRRPNDVLSTPLAFFFLWSNQNINLRSSPYTTTTPSTIILIYLRCNFFATVKKLIFNKTFPREYFVPGTLGATQERARVLSTLLVGLQ